MPISNSPWRKRASTTTFFGCDNYSQTIRRSRLQSLSETSAHTDRYLQATSNHQPSQKRAVIKTMMPRAREITEEGSTQKELQHLTRYLQAEGFQLKDIQRSVRLRRNNTTSRERAYLPYMQGETDRISKMLRKKNIATTFLSAAMIGRLLRSVK